MSHQKVKNVMSTDVLTVREDTTFKDVVRALASREVSAVPVVDRDGRVLGVVSEADLLIKQGTQELDLRHSVHAWWRGRRHLRRATGTVAGQVMSRPAITVGVDTTVAGAARLMTEHGLKRLPVVGVDGRLVGIVSRRDLLGVFLREDEDIRAEIVERVFEHGIGIMVNPTTVSVSVHDGEVTLTGQLELRSQLSLVESMTRHIDGVVNVAASLDYRHDDTKTRVPDAMAVDITRQPGR